MLRVILVAVGAALTAGAYHYLGDVPERDRLIVTVIVAVPFLIAVAWLSVRANRKPAVASVPTRGYPTRHGSFGDPADRR